MEACGSAHFWARKLEAVGHTAKLMAPQLVKLYVKGSKTDAADAEAICEAVSRPNRRLRYCRPWPKAWPPQTSRHITWQMFRLILWLGS